MIPVLLSLAPFFSALTPPDNAIPPAGAGFTSATPDYVYGWSQTLVVGTDEFNVGTVTVEDSPPSQPSRTGLRISAHHVGTFTLSNNSSVERTVLPEYLVSFQAEIEDGPLVCDTRTGVADSVAIPPNSTVTVQLSWPVQTFQLSERPGGHTQFTCFGWWYLDGGVSLIVDQAVEWLVGFDIFHRL